MMLAFLRANSHPVHHGVTLLFYGRRERDAAEARRWSDEMWRSVCNRSAHRFALECGAELTVLPCFGYIQMGDELFATVPHSIRNMLPSERGPSSSSVTTVWQFLFSSQEGKRLALRLSRPDGRDNMYSLQLVHSAARTTVWLERVRFVRDVHDAFSRVRRFLLRRAILRRVRARHFTKLAALVRMIDASGDACWCALRDTGVFHGQIVPAYLGLLPPAVSLPENNRVLKKLRGEKLVQTECSMQFG